MRTFTAIHCYGRVSDPSQVEGTGLERQLGNMETFCRKENISAPLTRLITDDGRSGFHGHHRSIGHLGVFEAEVARGEWRGSLFLCENLDRFSREGHDAGTDLLRKFIGGGVTVWTLDGDRFEADQRLDMMQAITAILKFELAHQESAKKSERNLSNWRIRRERCRLTGEAISKYGPPWLEIDPVTKRYRVIEYLAALVLRIFTMVDELSMGSYTVAKVLNAEGVPPFPQRYRNRVPRGWDHTYIDLLLKNRAVLGEYHPLSKGEPDGEPWQGYYPQIVPHDLFDKVERDAPLRAKTGRGRRRHSKKVHNLFAPLTRCHECGVAMHYNRETQRFARPMGSLHCPTNKRGGACSNDARWHYLAFEDGVLDTTLHLVMDERAFANRGELSRLDSTIAERERALELAKAKAARLWDAFAATGSENAQAAALAHDAECQRLTDNLAALVRQQAEASGRVDSAAHMKRIADIRTALYHPDPDERLRVRLKVSQHIHRLFENIEMGRERARVMLVAAAENPRLRNSSRALGCMCCGDHLNRQPIADIRTSATVHSSRTCRPRDRMANAKFVSRWIAVSAWALMLYIPAIATSFLGGYPRLGLALFFIAPVHMLLTMVLALYSLLSVRCCECGKRFFSNTYPVLPFESSCASCGATAANAR